MEVTGKAKVKMVRKAIKPGEPVHGAKVPLKASYKPEDGTQDFGAGYLPLKVVAAGALLQPVRMTITPGAEGIFPGSKSMQKVAHESED